MVLVETDQDGTVLEDIMAEISKGIRPQCMQRCEADFIKYSAQKPVGGVEALRICRETCTDEASPRR